MTKKIRLRHTELDDVCFECNVEADDNWTNEQRRDAAVARLALALLVQSVDLFPSCWKIDLGAKKDNPAPFRRIVRINTGCAYNRGQRISILIDPAHGAFFSDHSRIIEGVLEGQNLLIPDVIRAYVKGAYTRFTQDLVWLSLQDRWAVNNEFELPDDRFRDWSAEYRSEVMGR